MKTTKTIRFFNQNKNKGRLSSKSRSWNKKNKNKNTTSVNNILLQKKKEQCYDKKTYPKLVLNKLKIVENSTFIYTPWALNSRKFFKKLSIYMWPMCAHVHPWTMNELRFNLEWTKTQLGMNLNLTKSELRIN
jgi:hypothetical protein